MSYWCPNIHCISGLAGNILASFSICWDAPFWEENIRVQGLPDIIAEFDGTADNSK
jgi:hypothetical protein